MLAVPLCVHHSLEGEHVHGSKEPRAQLLSCRADSMGGKNSVNNRCRIAQHFRRNEIEVAPISSALLRIACLVILYKTCRVPDQELAADGGSGPVCGLALDYSSKMKIAVMVRQL